MGKGFSGWTHAAALAVGAGLAAVSIGDADNKNLKLSQNTAFGKLGSFEREHPEATGILDRALEKVKVPSLDPSSVANAALDFNSVEDVQNYLSSIEDGDPLKIAGALSYWLQNDAQGVLTFLLENNENRLITSAYPSAVASLDVKTLMSAVSLSPSAAFSGQLYSDLGKKLSELEAEEAAALLKQDKKYRVNAILDQLTARWPEDRVSELVDLVLQMKDDEWLARMVHIGDSRSSSRIFIEMLGRNDIPEAALSRIDPQYKAHLFRYADPDTSIEERIEQMKPLYEDDAAIQLDLALKQISTVDINALMKEGTDYRFAFRHGIMTAQEVLEAVSQELPQMAEASALETRTRVFNELASEDAKAAYALIEDLPDDARQLSILHQARWSFRDNTPDAFAAIIALADGNDTAQATIDRRDAWQAYTLNNFPEYGAYYLDWVREMPEGRDREAARVTLAQYLESSGQMELAEEFKTGE